MEDKITQLFVLLLPVYSSKFSFLRNQCTISQTLLYIFFQEFSIAFLSTVLDSLFFAHYWIGDLDELPCQVKQTDILGTAIDVA